MLFSEPLASFITFFMTSFIKFHHNSQRMSDSFYHITECRELKLKKRDPKHAQLAMKVSHVLEFCVGIHRYSALTVTSSNLFLHVCDTRKLIMAILRWKPGLLCNKS